jgi:hypothetical protein
MAHAPQKPVPKGTTRILLRLLFGRMRLIQMRDLPHPTMDLLVSLR